MRGWSHKTALQIATDHARLEPIQIGPDCWQLRCMCCHRDGNPRQWGRWQALNMHLTSKQHQQLAARLTAAEDAVRCVRVPSSRFAAMSRLAHIDGPCIQQLHHLQPVLQHRRLQRDQRMMEGDRALYAFWVHAALQSNVTMKGLEGLMRIAPNLIRLTPVSRRELSRHIGLACRIYELEHLRPCLDGGGPYSLIFDNHHVVCHPLHCIRSILPNPPATLSPSVCTSQSGQLLVVVVRGLGQEGLWQRVLGLWHSPYSMTAAMLAKSLLAVIDDIGLDLSRLQSLSCDRVAYNLRAVRSLRKAVAVCPSPHPHHHHHQNKKKKRKG